MTSGKLSATIEFNDDSQGSEPLGRTTTLEVDASGFRDTSGVGSGGQASGTLELSRVRELLLENFDTNELCALLDHVVQLRDLLVGTIAETA